MKRMSCLLAPLAALSVPSPAEAACNGLAGCSCTVTASGVSFGNYNPLSSTANDVTGTVRVNCTLLLALAGSFTVDLSAGASGSTSQRRLRRGTDSLTYNLYTDAARTQIWGDGAGGSTRVTRNFAALLSFADTMTVYARLPARQNVSAGNYSDTIIVTVTY